MLNFTTAKIEILRPEGSFEMPTVPVIPAAWPSFTDWLFLGPVLVLALMGMFLLLLDVAFLRVYRLEFRAKILGRLALAGSLVALGLSVAFLIPGFFQADILAVNQTIFNGTISFGPASAWLQVVGLLFLVLVVGLSMTSLFTSAQGEYYALLLWSAVGMVLMIEANELITLFVALEMMTISLYVLSGLEQKSAPSTEAALKYFIYGSAASALFLFGLSWLYGLTGTTRLSAVGDAIHAAGSGQFHAGKLRAGVALLLLVAGFGFKVASVPFHQWIPEVYEGAPVPVTAWIASGSKFAGFIAFMKVLGQGLGSWAGDPGQPGSMGWVVLLSILAAVSMTYGNAVALGQTHLKRLLAYSSISHAGYVLVGVVALGVSSRPAEAACAVLTYLCTYGLANLGAFAAVVWLIKDVGSDKIEDLNGLGSRRPVLAICLSILMLSFIGVPPLAGFMGKLAMFMEALNAPEKGGISLTWLVVLALLNSVASAYYYLRVVQALFLRHPHNGVGRSQPQGVAWPLLVAAVAAVWFGISPGAIMNPLNGAARSLVTPQDSLNRGESARFSFHESLRAPEGRLRVEVLNLKDTHPDKLSRIW